MIAAFIIVAFLLLVVVVALDVRRHRNGDES